MDSQAFGWRFPPTNGGRVDGFKRSGNSTFQWYSLLEPCAGDDTELTRCQS